MKNKHPDALPENWVKIDIDTCYQVVGGGTPSTSVEENWGGDTPWITSADIGGVREVNVTRYVTQKGIQESATNIVPHQTLLVATRVGLGKIAITDKPICFSQDLQGLVQRPDLILPEYGLFYLSFQLQRLKFEGRGTTISGITKKQLKDTEFPLPPYQEQNRIAAKIEELFSELDKGVASLKTAQAQLKVYRQAVLKHAFEGKLTAQWREENKDKLETPEQLLARIKQEREARYGRQLQGWKSAVKGWEDSGKSGKKPQRPKKPPKVTDLLRDVTANLPPLPESWVWEKLGWMTCGVGYGTAAKSATTGRVPVLRMGNIQNAKFDWADLVYTSDDNEIAEYLLRDGDVLFNRTNSPELVGKTAIYKGEHSAVFAGYLIRVNHIYTVVDSQYLNLFLNSHVARQHGNSVKTDGVNQSNINGAKLSNYPFPYCSIEEQREIASMLEVMFSVLDETEADIVQELQKADVLRQSILKKAFSGQLVPQDPHDEPASVLLDRIRAEREKAVKNNHSKKTKRRKMTA